LGAIRAFEVYSLVEVALGGVDIEEKTSYIVIDVMSVVSGGGELKLMRRASGTRPAPVLKPLPAFSLTVSKPKSRLDLAHYLGCRFCRQHRGQCRLSKEEKKTV
jgi:hypothetical protein